MGGETISVEGTTLSEWLRKREEADEADAILQYVTEEIVHHRKNIPAYTRSQQFKDRTYTSKGTPRVSTRVRYLSREEIEKEYGPMKEVKEEKETNKVKLLLKTLKTHGNITSPEAAKVTGYNLRTAGTTLWRFGQAWPGEFIIDKTERPQVFRISSLLRRKTVQELYQEYRDYNKALYKSKKKSKPSEPSNRAESYTNEEPPLNPSILETLESMMYRVFTHVISDLNVPAETQTKDMTLNINVTFGFKLGG